jgi:hypothetical protein
MKCFKPWVINVISFNRFLIDIVFSHVFVLYSYDNMTNRKVAGSRPDEVNDFYQVT